MSGPKHKRSNAQRIGYSSSSYSYHRLFSPPPTDYHIQNSPILSRTPKSDLPKLKYENGGFIERELAGKCCAILEKGRIGLEYSSNPVRTIIGEIKNRWENFQDVPSSQFAEASIGTLGIVQLKHSDNFYVLGTPKEHRALVEMAGNRLCDYSYILVEQFTVDQLQQILGTVSSESYTRSRDIVCFAKKDVLTPIHGRLVEARTGNRTYVVKLDDAEKTMSILGEVVGSFYGEFSGKKYEQLPKGEVGLATFASRPVYFEIKSETDFELLRESSANHYFALNPADPANMDKIRSQITVQKAFRGYNLV